MWSIFWDCDWEQKEQSSWSTAPLHGLLLRRNRLGVWVFLCCENVTNPVYFELQCQCHDNLFDDVFTLCCPSREEMIAPRLMMISSLHIFWIFILLALTQQPTPCCLLSYTWWRIQRYKVSISFICHHLKRKAWLIGNCSVSFFLT